MKTFTQLMNELAAHNTPDVVAEDETEVNEQTVHLVPHGGKGTHYKVVKGIKGQLEAGEVIHDSHVDDLRDIGIKTKILKEDEMSDDEKMIFESEDVTDLPFDDGLDGDGEEPINETPDPRAAAEWKRNAAKVRNPERTKTEEIKIATQQLRGDYKGHGAAMRKKHFREPEVMKFTANNLHEDEQIDELSVSTLKSYNQKAGRDIGKLGGQKFSVIAKHMAGGKTARQAADGFTKDPEFSRLADKQQKRADGQALAQKKIGAAGLRVPASK